MCDMAEISRISRENGIKIVEDAAQAFCGSLNGRRAGTFSSAAGFSMNPMKVFAACGEAGMVVTDDYETYNRLLSLRYNGMVKKVSSFNFRTFWFKYTFKC